MNDKTKEMMIYVALGMILAMVLMVLVVRSEQKIKAEVPFVPLAETTPTPVQGIVSLIDSQSSKDVYNRLMLRNCLQKLQTLKGGE